METIPSIPAWIVAVEMHDIEGAEDHGGGIAVDGLLQRVEIGQAGIIGDDRLALEDRVPDLELPRGFDEAGIFARPVGAAA